MHTIQHSHESLETIHTSFIPTQKNLYFARSISSRIYSLSHCYFLRVFITGYEPSKQIAIGLTVEQISQLSKWNGNQYSNQEMESAKRKSKQIQNSNRLTDGQEHKNIYASNAIEQHKSGLNRRSSKPNCNQSADGDWDLCLVNLKVTGTTLQQSAGSKWEGRQSQASVVVYA